MKTGKGSLIVPFLMGIVFFHGHLIGAQGPSNAITADSLHHYFWANYQLYNNNGPEAHLWFKKLMQTNPSMSVYKGYVAFLFGVGAHAQIVQLIPQLNSRFADDVEMQLIFAQALQKSGKIKESEELFITLGNRFKTNQAIIFEVARIYVSKKEPENALTVIDTLLNSSPKRANNFIFHFLKAQIYVQLNEQEKALAAVTACLEMHSHFDKGWLLFALLQEQKGELSGAISGYTKFLEVSSSKDPGIQNRLLQLVFKQKVAQKNMTSVADSDQPSLAQALQFFENKQYKAGLESVNKCLEKTPDDGQARLLKIHILSALNQFSQAAEVIKGWIYKKPDDQEWYHSLYLLCKSGLSHQKALAIFEDIVKKHPTLLTGYLYLADLNSRIGNVETALMNHSKALEIATDPVLKTKILFNMGQLYYAQQKYDSAQEVLEKGYALNQQFLPLLNLLAYHYATQSKDLKRADQLIDVVLKKSTSPHFLDTKALVLYKKKQYKKALKVLQAIEPQMTDDFSILKHLAKTHYRLGNKDEAVKIINKGLQVAQYDYEKKKANFMIAQWNK